MSSTSKPIKKSIRINTQTPSSTPDPPYPTRCRPTEQNEVYKTVGRPPIGPKQAHHRPTLRFFLTSYASENFESESWPSCSEGNIRQSVIWSSPEVKTGHLCRFSATVLRNHYILPIITSVKSFIGWVIEFIRNQRNTQIIFQKLLVT